ncbi:MAG: CDP-diacylglycerol--glycerol-3-phosphate 3-phosphatidyltransferase [Ruminococcaceae bacterium]|nr:CDP-diacylglycerol--glycerol-3-phosphate 3-phosphatidyltransferase [Oscillospiraceae bacterium]MBR3596562.1 CDP-diacylglycerol--glycerol-3-phosphate 3-phosphatidyltransferase [Clostridia bacterium]
MNLPNKLTVIRMVLTPVFLVVFLAPFIPYHYFIGLAVYIIGCITDFLDGKIARKYNLITTFGKLADPVADKMLTTAALLALMDAGYCSLYIVFIVLTREFAVTSVRLAASAQGVVIPANIWGKLKTASQMLSTVVIMFFIALNSVSIIPESFPLDTVSSVLLWITAVLAVISGIIYVKDGVKVIDFSK